MLYEIVPINALKPLEKVLPTHFRNLEEMIDKDGFMLKAIIADKKSGAVMDGSHRYAYLLKHGFKTAPVYWADYDDENVRVGTKLSHRFFIDGTTGISKNECRDRALSGNLFPPRTTRHFFTFRKNDITLPLSVLEKGPLVDVSWLVDDIEVSDELENNKRYLNEISAETDVIVQYLSEIWQTKEYLTKQIELMDLSRQIAFFPGKFHPPHLGHLRTILNILPKYRKLIVGVTEDAPSNNNVTCVDSIVSTLREVFYSFNNVEVVRISGVLTKKTDLTDLPKFDVLLSGNEEVITWAINTGIRAEYVQRSEGVFFSGTEIRDILMGNRDG